MKTVEKCTEVIPEVLSDNYLNATITRTAGQSRRGLIQKTRVAKLLKRSRRTLLDWEKLLTSCLDDWGRFSESRQYNFYQYYCLEKISRYQAREQPFRSLSDIESYIERNLNNFTLESYFSQF